MYTLRFPLPVFYMAAPGVEVSEYLFRTKSYSIVLFIFDLGRKHNELVLSHISGDQVIKF